MTIRIRISKIFRKVLNRIESAFLILFCFLCDIVIEVLTLKAYYWPALVIPFVRVYQLACGEQIVPAFAAQKYTYQSLWFYTWSRVLELTLYYIVAKKTDSLLFLTSTVLAVGVLMDEAVCPFGFYIGEVCYWFAAAAIVFRVWYKDHYLP